MKSKQIENQICPDCGDFAIPCLLDKHEFVYGNSLYAKNKEQEETVLTITNVPCYVCQKCKLHLFDYRFETKMHDAVCKYLNRLTPRQILIGKNKKKWNNEQLAQAIGEGFTVKMVQQLLDGIYIQEAEIDQKLRLLLLK